MNFFKRIYGTIVKPRETLAEIAAEAPLWQGVAILVVMSLLPIIFLFNRSTFLNMLGPADPYTINQMMTFIPIFMIIGVFSAMILTPIFHFIITAIYHLLAGFLGHKGEGKGLFSALAFANAPSIISSLIYFALLSFNMDIIAIISNLGFAIWVIVLKIFAIKEAHTMGGGKATLIYFIPAITFIVVMGIMIILGMLTLIPIIGSITEGLGIPM